MQISSQSQEIKNNPFEEIAHRLWNKIRVGQSKSYDILFELISSTVWQSPKELALKWIEKMAPDEWSSLSDIKTESIQVRKQKEAIRRRLLTYAGQFLYTIANQPTFFQRYSTRLLVRETLSCTLPSHDQDRIIASELMTKYHHWKSLLALMSQNDIESDERVLATEPTFLLGESGETECQLTYNGHIEPIQTLPDLSIEHTGQVMGMQLGPIVVAMQVAVSKVILSPDFLRRYGDSINPSEKEGKIRIMILNGLGDVPAYRKKSFGNNPSPKEPTGAWQASPA